MRLMQHVLKGPQDLTTSDGANDAIFRLMCQMGGVRALPQSLEWTIPLAPIEASNLDLIQRYTDWLRGWLWAHGRRRSLGGDSSG